METYVPTTPGGGILGGRGEDGELDGIQAWKKNMKEREKKEKEAEALAGSGSGSKADEYTDVASKSKSKALPRETPLDEIQVFKLLMKEAAKKEPEEAGASPIQSSATQTAPALDDRTFSGREELAENTGVSNALYNSRETDPSAGRALPANSSTVADNTSHIPPAPSTPAGAPGANEGARLLSLLSQGPTDPAIHSQAPKASTPSAPLDSSAPVSRIFPPSGSSTPSLQATERFPVDLSSGLPSSNSFNPPAGSRLLAFGSRAQVASGPSSGHKVLQSADSSLNSIISMSQPGLSTAQRSSGMTPPPGMGMNMHHQGPEVLTPYNSEGHISINPRATPSERSGRSYSPYSLSSHQEELHEAMRLAQASESLRRSAALTPLDRAMLGPGSENTSPYLEHGGSPQNFANGPGYDLGGNVMGNTASLAKGSRFAKFFDAKNREGQMNVPPRRTQGGMSTSPMPGQRHDPVALNGMGGNLPDSRTMEDLFAMLQNSSQVSSAGCRCAPCSDPDPPFRTTVLRLSCSSPPAFLLAVCMDTARLIFKLYSSNNSSSSNTSCNRTPALTPCTTVVSMTETLLQTGLFLVSVLLLAREAESLPRFSSPSRSTTRCTSTSSACNSRGTWSSSSILAKRSSSISNPASDVPVS